MKLIALAAVVFATTPRTAGEIVRLTPETWNRAPAGKEVDAIAGDYLLRNDRVVAVIGDAVPGRRAHLTCGSVQGAVLDFTLLDANNDQLTAFMPHGFPQPKAAATRAEIVKAAGTEVVLRVIRAAAEDDPVEAVTEYSLRDGESFLRVHTRYRNTSGRPARTSVSDKIRCDQTFSQTPAGTFEFVHFYDRWFRAAYGVVRTAGGIRTDGKSGGLSGANSGTWLDYPDLIGETGGRATLLQPGQELSLTRYLIAGRHSADVLRTALEIAGVAAARVEVSVSGPDGLPVAGADVAVRRDGTDVAAAFTDAEGRARFGLPTGRHAFVCSQLGRGQKEVVVDVAGDAGVAVRMGPLSRVEFEVVDQDGLPSPCKAQFLGVAGTAEPDLGPVQRHDGCRNLYFDHTGKFAVALPPGKYVVILSRGPEYDAAYRSVTVPEGRTAKVSARLPRVVDSRGWVTADFHNHSSESGDNTTLPESRIVCLVAEGIEFAPSTEHNRIQTYRHRLKALGLEKLLATSDGIELTGLPLLLNHQNAFPLKLHAHAQDGGGPAVDADPLKQIRRLHDHDHGSEKLVQQNHPDIGWLVYDKDGDGKPDDGFRTFEFTHVMEVWRTNILAMKPTQDRVVQGRPVVENNRVFNWLQLLNQGHRIPGVANSDAHTCFHESGEVFNWVKSSTDAVERIDEMEMVRASKKGRIVMSNGPFLEVSFNGALPGDDVRLSGGKGMLRVRVECANWLDVDRVQVLVNGRPDPKLNFRRETHPAPFGNGTVKFKGEIEVTLDKDAHLIVVAAGERATTGPVMGPSGEPPVAISNPIWVDVDGGGFQPSRDALDAPLPVKKP